MRVQFRPDIHCEDCEEITHIHFECPSCRDKEAYSTAHSELSYEWFGFKDILECELCYCKFRLINMDCKNSPYTMELEVIE